MALTSGTKLGPYEIQSPLGAGGMGEVYRARDTRLERTVAIKILNSQLAGNAELRGRFEREAKIISQLQHPHICVLHDVGSEGATEFLVMEYLEGESLADRLKRGPLAQEELLKIAIQLADALEKAHRAGVVHRDLKPGNVMLTKLGAKLLDFGLAKPTAANVANRHGSGSASVIAGALTQTSPTATPLSTAGAVIGTVQYMSPEQIQGIEADARSDIFAFGTMLYEMATGKRAFEGKTQASIVGQILAVDPPAASAVHPETSAALDRVVRLCLEKDPDERIQTAHDLKLNLQAVAEERPAATAALTQQRSSAHVRAGWIAAVIAALVLGALGAILLYHPAKPASTRTSINPPPNATFHLADDWAGPPVLSPDGKVIAFTDAARREIWVRPVNSLEAHPLEGTAGATFPFWSPDSRSLGFFIVAKGLKRVDLNGGSVTDVVAARQGRGGTWGPGGVIVFSPSPDAPLMKVNANGGTAEPLTGIDPSLHTSHRWPTFLPDGKHILYLALNHDASKASNDAMYYASLDGRENRLLFHTQSSPEYAAGYLLFARGDKLVAQSFDPDKGELKGDPQPIASGVILDGSDWHMDVSATEDGLLVYGSGATGMSQLVWLDRAGKDVGVAADNIAGAPTMRLSPQGDRLALQMESGMGTADIYVVDLARGVRARLTFGPVSNALPVWSGDGKWIYYSSLRNGHYGVFRRVADGSGDEESVFATDHDVLVTDVSRDGRTILLNDEVGDKTGVWALNLAGPRKPWKLVENGSYASFSPDGRYVAYRSQESGEFQVYVVPFGDRKGKWQVSSTSGALQRWSKDGKELFYVEFSNGTYSIVAVPVKEQGDQLQFGSPQTLTGLMNVSKFPVYDVSPDGKKILVTRLSQQSNQTVTLVTNFTEGLKK